MSIKMEFSVVKSIFILYSAISVCYCSSSMHLNQPSTARLEGNETDRLTLLAIKANIQHDPNRVTSTWNDSIHFCFWHGVTCSRRHQQRVTKLDLSSQNLAGSISPHVGNLSFLRELRLYNNSFTREIPPEIGSLHRLQFLGLQNNSFSGPIPANISNCFNLFILDVGYNILVGEIPPKLGGLSKLQYFVLQHNNLTGEIPPSLGNLTSLQAFALSYNNLVGSIPTSLGAWKQLTFFSVAVNNMSGTIPPSIYNMSTLLTFFSIGQNYIQGSLPSNLGNYFPRLQFFRISLNLFTGSIPQSISNATDLWTFQVPGNRLTGQVPDLRKLHNLGRFNIEGNQLGNGDWSFLSGLSNATKLESLILSDNNFGGTKLPTSISNLTTKLEQLQIEGNQLYGSIPAEIGNLVNLESLGLGRNDLTGNIPTHFGKLSKLVQLALHENELSGSVPSSLGNLSMLIDLMLQENNLQGNIPSSLGECHKILQLNLSQNRFNGSIPLQVFNGLPSLSISLDLSRNFFSGSLPEEVGKLKNLAILDASNNMLTGQLPKSLGSCESLEVLHLQGNFFEGPIPPSMTSLRGIQDLDLSRNNLSGEIPQFLEGVPLNNLNLSFNQFSGAVPIDGVFRNISATSIIGNTGLCGGIAKFSLPKCNSKESKGLSRSMKLIISIVSTFALLGIAMVLYYVHLSREKKKEIAVSALENSLLQVSYSTLLKATDGFSSTNLIGTGGFGSVYKGILDNDGVVVAVKVFNMLQKGASKSFIAECEALRNIRHRNLVKIITACSSVDFQGNDFKALVYQFMDNGSLEEWLHPSTRAEDVRDIDTTLNLVQRLDISIDVACALDYLHNHCDTPIVHCDLKPSNVLLDKELTGHVSDFGLARILSKLTNNVSENQSSSIGIRGTVGYAAPEYGMGSEVSTYGDIYSFGILLLEMFTGKRPTDCMFSDDLNLHHFVKTTLPERVAEIAGSMVLIGGINNINEAHHQSNVNTQKIEECVTSILGIGVACSAESPTNRKEMSDVASELQSIRDDLLS